MANGAVLHMSTESLYSYATDIDIEKSKLVDILENLDKSMNNVFNNSEGETITAIHDTYTLVKAQYEAFLQMMEAYANTLRTVANQMAEVDAIAASQITGLMKSN